MGTPAENAQLIAAIQEGFDRFAKTTYAGLARIFGSLAGRNEEPFVYCLRGGTQGGDGYLNMAATIGTVATGTIHIGQDADFIASSVHAFAVTTSTGVPMPPQLTTGPSYSVMMKNLSTDRSFMNVPCHNENVAGNAARDTWFTKNWLLRRNSDVQVTLTNLQAVATQVWVAIWGYKIFDAQALDLTGVRS